MYYHSMTDGFIEVPKCESCLNIYTVGCIHNCKGCHAKDLQDINHPERKTLVFKDIESRLGILPGFYRSICWLGGDPFYQFQDCLGLSLEIREAHPEMKIVAFTGYTFPEFFNGLTQEQQKIMCERQPFDYIIDGKWNGHKLGEEGCNQCVYKFSNGDFRKITYGEYKS